MERDMSVCPFCSSVYHSTYPPLSLSARQRRIYDVVVSGGQRGAPTKKLLEIAFEGTPPKSAWGVLRVNIFEMNRKLKDRGQRIKGRRDVGYVLVEDSDNETNAMED
jgi:hypothetical protein